jgi:hypothetical protein
MEYVDAVARVMLRWILRSKVRRCGLEYSGSEKAQWWAHAITAVNLQILTVPKNGHISYYVFHS